MKTTLMTIALFAAPLAFAASTTTTQTYNNSTTGYNSYGSQHYDTNSNDRFDNRDTRTNSMSTPASVGGDQSRLGADITSDRFVYPASNDVMFSESETVDQFQPRMSGSSTSSTDMNVQNRYVEPSSNDTQFSESESVDSSRLSGSATSNDINSEDWNTPKTVNPASDDTKFSNSETVDQNSSRYSGGAEGAAAGATAVESSGGETTAPTTATTSDTTTTTTMPKKMKKGKKVHKSGSSTDTTSYDSSAAADAPMGADLNSSDYNRDARTGSSTEDQSAAAVTSKDLTAQDTSRNKAETETVRKIRSQLASDKNLSTNAHNVKIIDQNGQIYLKGPVADANEKMKVEEIAKRFAGNTNVVNQTTIQSRSGSSQSTDSTNQ